jgi:hypothetical protein
MPLCSFDNLTNRVFRIPENQRGFAWESKHFDALIRDMKIATNLPQNKHYVGPVVIEDTNFTIRDNRERDLKKVSLEDGQQRVTTLMIIAKFLSNRLMHDFKAGDDEYDTGRELLRCYKFTPQLGGPENALLENQNPAFDAMIRSILLPPAAAPALDSQPLVRLDGMKTTVENWVNGLQIAALQNWANQILNSLQFTLIDLSNDINKYLAFDAINSRGVGLTEFDKVKNFCCLVYNIRGIGGTAPDRKWIQALQKLQTAGCVSRKDEETFICDLFTVHHKQSCAPSDVHEKMVSIYNDLLYNPTPGLETKLRQFVEEWDEYAESFGFVIAKDRTRFYPAGLEPKCNVNAKNQMIQLDNLDYLKLSRLLLTTCHRKFSPTDFAKAAELVEKFTFRVFGVMNKKTDTHKTYLVKAASSVYHGRDLAYVNAVICFLLHRPGTGAPMSSVIARLGNGDIKYTWETGGWDRCFYFLYEYETRTTGVGGYAWINQGPTQKQSMEHILPQNNDGGYWDAEWPDELEFEKHKHRLGNLVLTRDTVSNGHLGQKSIHDKIDDPMGGYDYTNGTNSEGQIHTHADAFGNRQWRPENIRHREIKLLKWAAKRWRVKCCDDRIGITLPEEFEEDGQNVVINPGFNNRGCIANEEPDYPPAPNPEE